MIRRPPRSTQSRSSAASDVYKRQVLHRDLASMGAANLPLLAVALSVPVMRESFNLTRLFQSAMFLLALPAVWGGLGLFGHLARRGSRLPLALVISAFVCYSIGLTSQVVGGVAHSSLNAPGPVSYTHLRAHETRHDL